MVARPSRGWVDLTGSTFTLSRNHARRLEPQPGYPIWRRASRYRLNCLQRLGLPRGGAPRVRQGERRVGGGISQRNRGGHARAEGSRPAASVSGLCVVHVAETRPVSLWLVSTPTTPAAQVRSCLKG